MFQSSKEAIQWIESIKRFGDKLDLSRMELACSILGNPQKEFPVIHIAGTNGKGSTVSYLRHILLENGYHVGTFTSPYIVRFNERITYDYHDISDEDLLFYINKIYRLHKEVENSFHEVITFFELVTLISFLYFRDKKVDFVIYEVGLGGRLDATNVVDPIMTAITSISYDHMGVLGDTLEEIATEKLGIVKQGVPLITAIDQEELYPLFKKHTRLKNSSLTIINREDIENIQYEKTTKFVYKQKPYKIQMLGVHQVINASLSIEIIHQLVALGHLKMDQKKLQSGLLKTKWPGRLERFGNIIIDGAHNIGGVEKLKDSMEILFPDYTIKVLYTAMADKEYFDMIQVIETFADEITFTEIEYERCETAENLYNVSQHPQKKMNDDPLDALKQLGDLKEKEILLITGSLYFISFIRKYLE
jgi:dihydrofolate synthase/folylpolyglutamate synthase